MQIEARRLLAGLTAASLILAGSLPLMAQDKKIVKSCGGAKDGAKQVEKSKRHVADKSADKMGTKGGDSTNKAKTADKNK